MFRQACQKDSDISIHGALHKTWPGLTIPLMWRTVPGVAGAVSGRGFVDAAFIAEDPDDP
ncbi:hypothetical protein MES4922_110390 [Mesorhizobium ventifaucium]|uniref:Uncharacterized protein n=1 Tax=Mesorhizobium ventifaucium TaxID=666020 RepID=A0ABN8JEE6_9HYPH|nr:hypothetical protein MES4922_110390 [Mesorhizobium ventifaucium]